MERVIEKKILNGELDLTTAEKISTCFKEETFHVQGTETMMGIRNHENFIAQNRGESKHQGFSNAS